MRFPRPDWYLVRRRIRFFWQRRIRGWDDSVTWGLDRTIATFVLPRLRRFRELNNGFPAGLSEDEWNAMLDDMIYAFDACTKEDCELFDLSKEEWSRVDRGLLVFGAQFRQLWW